MGLLGFRMQSPFAATIIYKRELSSRPLQLKTENYVLVRAMDFCADPRQKSEKPSDFCCRLSLCIQWISLQFWTWISPIPVCPMRLPTVVETVSKRQPTYFFPRHRFHIRE